MSSSQIQTVENGSITSTPGFEAAGVSCGLKPGGALDLALLFAPHPCVAAGVFTTNAFKAAPVLYDQAILAHNPAGLRAVVINSGCANACTGERGMRDAEATARAAASALGVTPDDVALMSTGVIGKPLPMDKILSGVTHAVAERAATVEAGHMIARAIMTTDTRPKECAVRVTLGAHTFTIAGMAKGAGMIHPNMATMLCLVTSDIPLRVDLASRALREAIEPSFHSITVDGDTSTNDTVLFMANGSAHMPALADTTAPVWCAFVQGLQQVLVQLAQAIVRDGEGATHMITITVRGARDATEARQVAMAVAKSSLVKTAIYGRDANWGRIICAVGYSGVPIDAQRVGIWLGDLELVRSGTPYDINEERAAAILAQADVSIGIDLALGTSETTVWTCDLSHGYVDINAHYRT
jgi:glutamate N-acetyltransferase/amino-acid N-acetyltransferase